MPSICTWLFPVQLVSKEYLIESNIEIVCINDTFIHTILTSFHISQLLPTIAHQPSDICQSFLHLILHPLLSNKPFLLSYLPYIHALTECRERTSILQPTIMVAIVGESFELQNYNVKPSSQFSMWIHVIRMTS